MWFFSLSVVPPDNNNNNFHSISITRCSTHPPSPPLSILLATLPNKITLEILMVYPHSLSLSRINNKNQSTLIIYCYYAKNISQRKCYCRIDGSHKKITHSNLEIFSPQNLRSDIVLKEWRQTTMVWQQELAGTMNKNSFPIQFQIPISTWKEGKLGMSLYQLATHSCSPSSLLTTLTATATWNTPYRQPYPVRMVRKNFRFQSNPLLYGQWGC